MASTHDALDPGLQARPLTLEQEFKERPQARLLLAEICPATRTIFLSPGSCPQRALRNVYSAILHRGQALLPAEDRRPAPRSLVRWASTHSDQPTRPQIRVQSRGPYRLFSWDTKVFDGP